MIRRLTVLVGVFILVLPGCSQQHRDIGHYRTPERIEPQYLGTCGSPGFITDSVHMPGDPSCFSVSASGESAVYLHRPEICGAGKNATDKPGGVYIHSALEGDRIIYPRSQIEQEWGGEVLDPGALRVSWRAKTPSRAGAAGGQSLVIHVDGSEEVFGKADSFLCQGP